MAKMTISQELLEWARELKNSVSAELPLLAKEILYYKVADSIIEIVLFSFFLFLCVKIQICIYKNSIDNRNTIYEDNFEFGILAFLASIPCVFFIVINLSRLVKIYFAPKMYVLEYVIDLVHK